MHVEITIVAKDYDQGKQATRKEELEVPKRVLKMFEMFAGGKSDQLLRWVSDTIFGAAIREVQGSGKGGKLTSAMASSGGGRIGGRGSHGENPTADNLAEHLGLDVLRAGVAKDRGQTPQQPQQRPVQPQPVPQQGAPQTGPGPIGFGSPRPQQPMGPGPMGYSADRPINPGPGPGPIGFGPDRGK